MKNKQQKKEMFMNMVEREYNMGLTDFLMEVNKDNLDKCALWYRGRRITYGEMFSKAKDYARSMQAMGIYEGMEIPICMANTPELVYTILGASLIGAKINIFGNVFDKDYVEEIINGTDAKVLFITDDMYQELADVIPKTNVKQVVMTSLTDSYPVFGNRYEKLEKKYFEKVKKTSYSIKNRVPVYKRLCNKIIDKNEFRQLGVNGSFSHYKWDLDEKFSTTYSSGSTNSHRPKAIQHRLKSFNAMGVAHNGYDTPKMKDLRVLAQIPSHSNTDIISSITDTLSQGCTCCLEPIYDEKFFPYSLLINKPNFACATRSFWLRAFKEYRFNPEFENTRLGFLMVPMSVGEPTGPGEEKFMNESLRKLSAGKDKLPITTVMSMAGGCCEIGGLFFTMFKAWMEKDPRRVVRKEQKGYSTYRMVTVGILDNDGKVTQESYTIGEIVVDSPTNMLGYKNDLEATEEAFIYQDGRQYYRMKLHGYLDRYGDMHLKGRMNEKEEVPMFMVQDTIAKDTKNILSCEVVETDGMIVADIEFQPGVVGTQKRHNILLGALARIVSEFDFSISERVLFRIVEDGYPLTACGKRDAKVLVAMGLENTCRIHSFECYSGEDYAKFIKSAQRIHLG